MKRSVGLVVMVRIPKDGKEILMAVLQRRGRWNTEKMAPESYPGCCQVTCHGKLKDGETFFQGLYRECHEELGTSFGDYIQADCRLETLRWETTEEKEFMTLGVIVHMMKLEMIRLGPDSGGLELITRNQVQDIFSLTQEGKDLKEKGPSRRDSLYMFPDEIEAVRKAFGVFG